MHFLASEIYFGIYIFFYILIIFLIELHCLQHIHGIYLKYLYFSHTNINGYRFKDRLSRRVRTAGELGGARLPLIRHGLP